jgi:ubiquinone/menaquinone biosynthesis C-methylase UbiE
MSRPRRSAVQRYHDRVAPRYDDSYDDDYWQWHDGLTWEYLKPHLPGDANSAVVDLGCGTGKWAARLAKSGYTLTCVDISARMLDQARRKIAPLDPHGRARFLQADLCDLSDLPAQSFALAVAFGEPLGSTKSPRQALRQIRRLLAPGGILVATVDNRLAAIDFHLQQGDADVLARFLRDGKTHWLTKDRDERFTIHTFAPSDVRPLAGACGFEVLEIIGKTVLPMRHYRGLLDSPQSRRAWANIEKKLARETDAVGRAAHLQIALRAV